MADKRISELTALTGANSADDDLLVIVDSSASETKSITLGELEKALGERDFSFADDDKLVFGDGDDLQIYHDSATSTNKVVGNIDVTGTVTADGLTIDAGNAITLNTNSSDDFLTIIQGPDTANITADSTAGNANLALFTTSVGNTRQRLLLNNNGDISFYEDTGTTAKFFWDASAESLYIGNTNPSFAGTLDVTGTITSRVASAGQTTNFNVRDSDLDDLFRIITDGTTGEARIGAASDTTPFMTFYTGASERMRIDSSGNVGIGTSDPQNVIDLGLGTNARGIVWGGSTGSNHYSSIWTEYGTGSIVIGAGLKGSTTNQDFIYPYTGTYGYAAIELDNFSDDGIKFYTAADGSRTKDAVATKQERMRIDTSGNVGIGTASPLLGLTIVGDDGDPASSGATATGALQIQQGTNDVVLEAGVKSNTDRYAWLQATNKTDHANNYNMALNPNGGNVGIGTTSPSAPLHIKTGGDMMRLESTGATGSNYIEFYDTTARKGYIGYGSSSTDDLQFYQGDSANMVFATSGTERMRIDSSGNLLVGTTSELGGSNAKFYVSNLNDTYCATLEDDSGNTGFIRFNNASGTQVGSITRSGTSTVYGTSSDERLKENIQDADSAGSVIDNIQVRQYDWIADGEHQRYGMIAQELNAVAPEAVTQGETDDDMWSVDYSKLVPMLVKEIQDLRKRVADLEGN